MTEVERCLKSNCKNFHFEPRQDVSWASTFYWTSFQRRHRHSVLSLSVKALQQTNLGALHGLQQVGERLFETADEHPTELLEQSAETRHGCPETHTHNIYHFKLCKSTKLL